MTTNFRLEKSKVALVVIDVQEKLFALVERPCEVMHAIQKMVKAFQIMDLPIIHTEQYPEGLGPTVIGLKNLLGDKIKCFKKTTFSCVSDPEIQKELLKFDQLILVGIEAHVCVLQTAKDLLRQGKEVTILNHAITSRSIYDYSTAILESSEAGARISTVETVLFELLQDSKSKEFKAISQLLK